MAATTKTHPGPPRATKRLASPAQPAWPARLRARLDGLAEAMPSFAGSSRLRREVLGVILVLVALLTAVVLGRGGDDGRLVDWWGSVLVDSFGHAAPLVPLLLGLAALRALGNQPGPVLEARHYLGGFLFAVGVVGLLQLGAGLDDPAGGYFGIAVATLSLRILGQLGAGLVHFTVGVFAVFLLAGSDLQTFGADLHALLTLIGKGIARIVRAIAGAIGFLYAALFAAFGGSARAAHRRSTSAPAGALIAAPAPRPGRVSDPTPSHDLPVVRLPEPPRRLVSAPLPDAAPTPIQPAPTPVPPTVPVAADPPALLVLDHDHHDAPNPIGETEDNRLDQDLDESTVADDQAPDLDDAAAEAEAVAEPPPPAADRRPLLRLPRMARSSGQNGADPAPNSDVATVRLPPQGAEAAPLPSRATTAEASIALPALNQLTYYDPVAPDTGDLHAKARLIEETLASFKVEARVREINPGPAVTQFALEPGVGIKVRRITELQNDLALALAAPSIRIEAPVPGHARVGLEIPNAQIATVGLRETLESPAMTKGKAKLPMPLGQDVNGRHVVGDLTKMPHILIAGATGAGKSVCLNCIISTFLLCKRPTDLKLVMIDPKMVELTGYNGVPHLQCPVVTEMDKVVGALRLTVREMERRYALFAQLGVRNYDGYRLKVADEPNAEQIPYLVLIIDELADLMMTTPDDVENLLVRLGQMGRAAGIHLILATQRPSVDVVTGLIKTNVPSRIAFAVSSLTDSRVVLDMPGAERLLGRGDMLYLPADAAKPQRIQGAFLEDRDAQSIVDHWRRVVPEPNYAQEWLELPSSNSGGGGSFEPGEEEDDPLFEQALGIVKRHGTASASMLQRRLRVGYNRAARLIERMEDEGLIGPADGVRGRPVLFGDD